MTNPKVVHFLLLISLIAALFFPLQRVHAHAADQYLHEIELQIQKDELVLNWFLKPGPFLSGATWVEANLNSDEQVSAQEAQRFCEKMLDQLAISIGNQSHADWQISECIWPESQDELSLGAGIHLKASHPLEDLQGNLTDISIENNFHPTYSVTLYTIQLENGWQIQEISQNLNQLSGTLSAASEENLPTLWVSQQPDLSAFDGQNQQIPGTNQTIRDRLNRILEEAQNNTSAGFIISAALVAMLLGMLHAFTPGHGKSIVAAYMIGAKGSWLQGTIMGLIVAVTHTGTVILTGLLVLLGARFVVIENIYPLLEVVSAVLILGLGIFFLIQRLRYIQKQKQSQEKPPSEVIQEENGQQRIIIRQDILEETPPHPHIGPRYVPRHRANLQKLEWRTLLALGTSGGLVPCPDAVAVFIIAATLNMLNLGMLMIVAFSIGISIILMLLGFLIARGKRNLEKIKGFQRIITFAPIASAAILVIVGLYLLNSVYQRYQPALAGGFSKTASTASFEVESAQIAYLDYDEANLWQIFVFDVSDSSIRQITQTETGVSSFILASKIDELYFTLYNPEEDQGEIWQVNLNTLATAQQVALSGATVFNLSLTPQQDWVFFERTNLAPSASNMVETSIWKWQPDTNTLEPLLNNEHLTSFSPSFSPQMNWFSYFNPNANRYEIYNLETGSEIQVDNQIGSMIEWEPDEEGKILIPDTVGTGKAFAMHFIIVDLLKNTRIDLSQETGLLLRNAFWNDENIIAMTFETGENAGNRFYQIDPNTYQTTALTETTPALPSDFDWSPDQKVLLFQQWSVANQPEWNGIWYLDLESDIIQRLYEFGYHPRWLSWE